MKITKTKLRKIINEELDAILDEAKKGDWPKKLKKGRFTKYCKRQGFERGPGIGCAETAMDSDSASVRGMASFYTNTVKKEGCGELQERYPEDPGADQRDDDERMLHSLERALEDAEDAGAYEDAEKIAAEIADLKKGPYGGHASEEELMDAVADLFKEEETPGMSDIKDLDGEDTLEEAEMSGDLSGVPADALAALMANAMTEPEVEAAIKDPLERMIMDAIEKVMAKFSA